MYIYFEAHPRTGRTVIIYGQVHVVVYMTRSFLKVNAKSELIAGNDKSPRNVR